MNVLEMTNEQRKVYIRAKASERVKNKLKWKYENILNKTNNN